MDIFRIGGAWRLAAVTLCAVVAFGAASAAADPSIVISLTDRRLYLLDAGPAARSFPVAIGRPGVATPLGDTAVVRKRRNPTWRPTANQRRADPDLPRAVPPGPANPLGKFALDLGWPSYAIHGTNRPDSVGRRASGGCFRMLPDDIEALFATVPVGTSVRVIRGTYSPIPEPEPVRAPPAAPAPVPMPVRPAPPPSPRVVADPRCASATAPLQRMVCDVPELAALDGRARALAEDHLAGLPAHSRTAAAIFLHQENRRFGERVGAACWIRRGSESDPAVAAAAVACLRGALAARLAERERRFVASRRADLAVR